MMESQLDENKGKCRDRTNGRRNKDHLAYMSNLKPTEKLIWPHGLDDERGLQQVEGKRLASWRAASLDYRNLHFKMCL